MKKPYCQKEDLETLHGGDYKPIMTSEGYIGCAYSLEESPRACPYNHRGPQKIQVIISGKVVKIFACYDGRTRGLAIHDYICLQGK